MTTTTTTKASGSDVRPPHLLHDTHDQLRRRGFRLTPQRMLIMDVINGAHHHISAEQIHAAVVACYPYINIATVYRNLHWLLDQQLVRKIDVGDGLLWWEAAGAVVHHHLICERCKAVAEIDNHVVACFANHVAEHYGFAVNLAHLPIFGLCAECRSSSEPL